jgi:hypothetical protein
MIRREEQHRGRNELLCIYIYMCALCYCCRCCCFFLIYNLPCASVSVRIIVVVLCSESRGVRVLHISYNVSYYDISPI